MTLGYEDRTLLQWKFEHCKLTLGLVENTTPTPSLMLEILSADTEEKQPRKPDAQNYIQSTFLESVMDNESHWRSEEDSYKIPPCSLKLKYIYGGQFHLRNSLHYAHIHTGDTSKPTCDRMICYSISKYGVAFNPFNSTQTFYTQHCSKITAMDVHAEEPIAATSSESDIHVWRVSNSGLISKMKCNVGSVFILKFGNKRQGGDILIAIGKLDQQYLAQIFNWKHQRTLVRASLGSSPVQDLKFHPAELFTFAVCGINSLSIWKRQGRYLRCKQEIAVQKEITCLEYIIVPLGITKEVADMILGTGSGELLIYIDGKISLKTERAHQGAILCICSTTYSSQVFIITTGVDGFLHIWNKGLNLVNKLHISSISDPILSHLVRYT